MSRLTTMENLSGRLRLRSCCGPALPRSICDLFLLRSGTAILQRRLPHANEAAVDSGCWPPISSLTQRQRKASPAAARVPTKPDLGDASAFSYDHQLGRSRRPDSASMCHWSTGATGPSILRTWIAETALTEKSHSARRSHLFTFTRSATST